MCIIIFVQLDLAVNVFQSVAETLDRRFVFVIQRCSIDALPSITP